MRLLSIAIPLLSLLPLALSLQAIYLGVDVASGLDGRYIAWFTDSDPCYDGTEFGFLPFGFENCDQDLTILGHPNITFTGNCTNGYVPGEPAVNLPTGVSDGGVPALTCVPARNPPDAPDYENGGFANCVYKPVVAIVSVIEYCS